MFPRRLRARVKRLLPECERQGITVAVAESCTGGLLSALLTETPGASQVFERGFVTYSNAAKTELLGIKKSLLERYGAVSHEIAAAMAEGALKHSRADVSLAVTGIAGPGGGGPDKPVGLVYIALAERGTQTLTERHHFQGTRAAIRAAAVNHSLALLKARLNRSVERRPRRRQT